MKCSKECPTKREKNNEAARKCRQKRKKFIETTLQEAKQAVEFNRFIRKELLSFYQSIRCPVPNSSMLFFESSAAAYLGRLALIFIIYILSTKLIRQDIFCMLEISQGNDWYPINLS